MRRSPARSVGAATAALVALALAAGSVLADPGDLDPAFSGDGMRQISFSTAGDDEAADVTLGAGDQPIIAGGANGDMVAVRLRANGSNDRAFSGDGRQEVDFGAFESAFGVATQGTKVLLAGIRAGSRSVRGAVARLNATGARDSTFSGDGRATLSMAGFATVTLLAVADGGDGRVIVVGSADNGADDRHAIIARFTSAGALDRTFSGDGIRVIDIPGGQAQDLHVLASGRILVLLRADEEDAVIRLLPGGADDTSFGGGDGRFDLPPGHLATAMAVRNGRIFVLGDEGDMFVMRLLGSGTPDVTFGGDGLVIVASEALGETSEQDIAVDAEGRMAIAARSANQQIIQLTRSGDLDKGFASGHGFVEVGGPGFDSLPAVAIDSQRRIVAAGTITKEGADDQDPVVYRVLTS